MGTTEKKTAYGTAAGILLLLATVTWMIPSIRNLNFSYMGHYVLPYLGQFIFTLIGGVLLGVGMILSRGPVGKILAMIGSLLRAGAPVVNVILTLLINHYWSGLNFRMVLMIVGFLLLAGAALLSMLDSGKNILGKVWFVPGLVITIYTVSCVVPIVSDGFFGVSYLLRIVLPQVLPLVLLMIGTILGGAALAWGSVTKPAQPAWQGQAPVQNDWQNQQAWQQPVQNDWQSQQAWQQPVQNDWQNQQAWQQPVQNDWQSQQAWQQPVQNDWQDQQPAWQEGGEQPSEPAKWNETQIFQDAPDAGQEDDTAWAIGEIRKYKALLDDGVITQEDFEAKKKQLLGL